MIRERAEFVLYRFITRVVDRATDDGARRQGERIGLLAAKLLPKRRQLVLRNLAYVFPEKDLGERQAIARSCWKHFGSMTIDYVRKRHWTLDRIIGQVKLNGWEHLEQAMSRDRGVIVVTAHIGNWEIGLNVLSRAGVRVMTVARALDNELLEEELYGVRRRSGIDLVDRRHAARPLIRALEKKEIVVLLPDQAVQPREGVLVPFLDRPAWTTPAPARLALRYDVPIVPMFCTLDNEPRLTLNIQQPIYPSELAVELQTVEAVTAFMNERISSAIRGKPELWLWMHDRWKWTERKDAEASRF